MATSALLNAGESKSSKLFTSIIDTISCPRSIAIRSMVYLGLSYDHRVVDGADAARFLSSMKVRLEEANFESELGL